MLRAHPLPVVSGLVVVLLTAVAPSTATGQEPGSVQPRPTVLPPMVTAATAGATSSPPTRGRLRVVVRLSEPAPLTVVEENAIAERALGPSRGRQRRARDGVRAQQTRVAAHANALGAETLARLEKSMNALVLGVDAAHIPALRALPDVAAVTPVSHFETPPQDPAPSGSLAQAAEYLEASEPRARGLDGSGVAVAVFDSGVDFTHAYLGGPGTPAFYTQCYTGSGSPAAHTQAPTGECASFFGPDAPKVVGGYDFVGETWPGTVERPDPNPIDREGHGTHVADIVGGRSPDGSHLGLAPGVRLYAYKVCSAVSTSCSGLALLQAVEAAIDPNNDGDFDDAPAVWNFSLGAPYGQREDDLTFVLNAVVRAGVVVLAAAGNDANVPWIVSSPSTGRNLISVAQTALPDDTYTRIVINYPLIPAIPGNVIRNAIYLTWSAPLTAPISADLARPAGPLGCTLADFTGFPAGSIALIDRGTCAASIKVSNASAAGAVAAIIANNVPGPPPDFIFGGGTPLIPGYSISQNDGNALKAAPPPVNVTIDPSNLTRLRNATVTTTSRGPAIQGARVKPDLGAPGAWLSAEVGTGNGETSFGGTSGATPTVAGAAAILRQQFPNASPFQIKRRLINAANTDTQSVDPRGNLSPAPVTRIGGGEIRVEPSLETDILAGDVDNGQGNLSFGVQYVAGPLADVRVLRLRNASPDARTFSFSASYRDPAEAALNAVTVYAAPATVPGRSQVDVPVYFFSLGTSLPPWPYVDPSGFSSAGQLGNDGELFSGPEFDGTLTIRANDGASSHVAWHVLPRRAAWVTGPSAVRTDRSGLGALRLTNQSLVAEGLIEVFGLTGTSERDPRPEPGEPGSPGSNVAVVDLAAVGVRDFVGDDAIQFAISTFGRRKSPVIPGGFQVEVDVTLDGRPEYLVYNGPFGGNFRDGRSVVFVYTVATGRSAAYFFTDIDFDSGNIILTAPLSALGLGPGARFDIDVYAYDNYSGPDTDAVVDMTWTVGSSKYRVVEGETLALPPATAAVGTVQDTGTATKSTQQGVLLLYRNNRGAEFDRVLVTPRPAAQPTTTPQ